MYNVQIDEQQNLQGLFTEALLSSKDIWISCLDSENKLAYNDFIIIKNNRIVDIVNEDNLNNSDKSILVLGDSFSALISTYMSEETGEIVAMHPAGFPGSVKAYIDSYKPDVVIMMYQEGQVGYKNNVNYKRLNE